METGSAYEVWKEDVQRMCELAGMEFVDGSRDEAGLDELVLDGDRVFDPERIQQLLREMAEAAFNTTEDDGRLFVFWCENAERIRRAAQVSDEVTEMLLLGFRAAISSGNALCMNCLGALYYMGDMVEQDYAKAAELYEMAMEHGCYQSIINLGYIYEYGRTGAPDYEKAYRYYSLAAALASSSEAAYKLGDMYSRGRGVKRDMKKAHALYMRSLDLAKGDVAAAQPAIRLAKMYIDPEGPGYGVECDPLYALALFQRAEIGLRKDIANGQFYYKKRLVEAIEGQVAARQMLEMSEGFIDCL